MPKPPMVICRRQTFEWTGPCRFHPRPNSAGDQRPHPARDCRLHRVEQRRRKRGGLLPELLAADPNNGLNQLRAGTAFALAGASLEAEGAFLTAAELAPESAVPLSNLARLYLAGGDLEGAVKAYQRASAIDPTSPDLDEIAESLRAAGANIDP